MSTRIAAPLLALALLLPSSAIPIAAQEPDAGSGTDFSDPATWDE